MGLDLLLLQLYKVCFDCMAHIVTLCIITFRQVVGGLPNTAAWIQSEAVWFNKGKVYFGTRQCTFLSYEYYISPPQASFASHNVFVFALLKSKNAKLSKAMPGSQPWTKFINPVTFSNYRAM